MAAYTLGQKVRVVSDIGPHCGLATGSIATIGSVDAQRSGVILITSLGLNYFALMNDIETLDRDGS